MFQEWIFESSRPGLVLTVDGQRCLFLQYGSDSRWLFRTSDPLLAIDLLDANLEGVELISGNGYQKKKVSSELTPFELSALES